MRTYTAVLTQTGPAVSATLEGAEFYAQPQGQSNHFNGIVQPHQVTFRLGAPFDYYFYLPEVLERLPTPTSVYLAIVGDAVTTESNGRRSGSLDGVIETMDVNFRRVASCRSRNHQFLLTR
jgi:hypothetical protein